MAELLNRERSGGGVTVSGDNTWTGAQTFRDNKFTITDDSDTTKAFVFEVSGVTTGTTRTLTVPNANSTLAVLGLAQTFTADQTINSNTNLRIGGTSNSFAKIIWSTSQTPDTVCFGPGSTGNSFIFCESADTGFDFAHAQQTNPTLYGHSAVQSTTQWWGITHDQTNARFTTGTDAPFHFTGPGSTSGVLIGNFTGVADRAFVGANTGSTYMVHGTGSTGLLWINNGGNTFLASLGNAGNFRVGDSTIGTARFEVDNLAVAQSIAVFMDNGTPVVSILDGGITRFNNSGNEGIIDIGSASSYTRLQANGTSGFWQVDSNYANVNYYFKQNAVITQQWGAAASGTDANGVDTIQSAGRGTGAGIGAGYKIQTSPPIGTGTTLQTLGDRVNVIGKYTTLTESSATAFASVTVASGTVAGGLLVYTVEANDATDYQALSGSIPYSIVNKAGTLTIVLGTDSQASSTSTGTLTGTISMTDAGSGVAQFKMSAVSSLTQTTLRINCQVLKNFGTGAIAAV